MRKPISRVRRAALGSRNCEPYQFR
jgi:hypothetical protein